MWQLNLDCHVRPCEASARLGRGGLQLGRGELRRGEGVCTAICAEMGNVGEMGVYAGPVMVGGVLRKRRASEGHLP